MTTWVYIVLETLAHVVTVLDLVKRQNLARLLESGWLAETVAFAREEQAAP